MIGDDVDALADLRPLIAFARVDFAVLFAQSHDLRLRVFDDVTEARRVTVLGVAVLRERL